MMSPTERVDQMANSPWITLMSRMAIGLTAFLAIQVWNDTKENHDRVTAILINQAVAEQKLDEAMRRISKIEASDHAEIVLPNFGPMPVNEWKAKP